MLKRKINTVFNEWKRQCNGRTALLVEGARRVGKSVSVLEFAKEQYRSYIVVDFNQAKPEVRALFDEYLDDLDTLFMYLSTFYKTQLYPRESLIIFDEVELCPRARSAIKYLVADGRYDYIETGSLMSIRANVQDILIPSEEHHVQMYPLDFEEFLWAMGNEMMMEAIKECFHKAKPMGILHRKAMDYFRQYMIIGGMPQAVTAWQETRDFNSVDIIKRDIIDLYRSDIAKHAGGYDLKVRQLFDGIPGQLGKHDKKFRLSSLGTNARMRDYEDAFMWLSDSMIANIAFNSVAPDIGLRLNENRMTQKCYMGDTGLLLSHSFNESSLVSEDIYNRILLDKLEFNEGMIAENIVSQMLVASGHELYFYSNASKEQQMRMEIDFLISKSKVGNRHNISLIEVKSGKNYTLTSLRKCISKYSEQVGNAYVIHTSDIRLEEGITFMPLYMTPLL